MLTRKLVRLLTLIALAMTTSVLVSPAPASASTSALTFVKAYSNIVNTTQFALTPEDVQAASDGGYVGLAVTQSSSSTRPGVSWLLKLNASGGTQWQRALGCMSTPPGDYADGVSVAQAADGGYVVAGGTIGCGSGPNCPPSSGIACALVEKVSATGKVAWARVYHAGAAASALQKIRQTSDGGYIAVGTVTDASQNNAPLFLKLDSQGNVQWQRQLGPSGQIQALLNDVRQSADGGYVVTGELQTPSASGFPNQSVLAAKLDSGGGVLWERAFNSFASRGIPNASENALSLIQSSDGGYVIAGNWGDATGPNQCCSGALLLKLNAAGNIRWQSAYSGGLYCFENGFNETCANLGAVAYSVHQTSDGGYVLVGDANLKLRDSIPLVPWIAKVDPSGNLLWQHDYYQANRFTGRPISEYFASAAPSSDGGFLGLGFTENASTGTGELFAVKTDSSGLAGAGCSDVHGATALNPVNPALTAVSESLPIATAVAPTGNSPATTMTTSVATQSDC